MKYFIFCILFSFLGIANAADNAGATTEGISAKATLIKSTDLTGRAL